MPNFDPKSLRDNAIQNEKPKKKPPGFLFSKNMANY